MGGKSEKSPFWSDPLGTTAKALGSAVENVVKNPLPVIETIALTYALGPAGLGYSTATSAAVSSAAVTAANGGCVRICWRYSGRSRGWWNKRTF